METTHLIEFMHGKQFLKCLISSSDVLTFSVKSIAKIIKKK